MTRRILRRIAAILLPILAIAFALVKLYQVNPAGTIEAGVFLVIGVYVVTSSMLTHDLLEYANDRPPLRMPWLNHGHLWGPMLLVFGPGVVVVGTVCMMLYTAYELLAFIWSGLRLCGALLRRITGRRSQPTTPAEEPATPDPSAQPELDPAGPEQPAPDNQPAVRHVVLRIAVDGGQCLFSAVQRFVQAASRVPGLRLEWFVSATPDGTTDWYHAAARVAVDFPDPSRVAFDNLDGSRTTVTFGTDPAQAGLPATVEPAEPEAEEQSNPADAATDGASTEDPATTG